MSKNNKLLIGSSFLIIAVISYFVIQEFNSRHRVKVKPSGEIMIQNIDQDGGLFILDLEKEEKKHFLKQENVNDPVFVLESNDILFVSYFLSQDKTKYFSKIKLFNFVTKQIEEITSLSYEVRYPDLLSNKRISFIDNDGYIHLFDLQSKEDTILYNVGRLDDDAIEISWGKNYENFLISARGKIYQYSLKTKQKNYIADGFTPTFSKDYSRIAYISPDQGRKLVIMDLATRQKQIIKDTGEVVLISWSPDGKSIAYIRGSKYYLSDFFELSILDVKSRLTKKVLSLRNPSRISWR